MRVVKSDAHDLRELRYKHESAVLRLATDSDIAFTNSRAEAGLARMSKVEQKVSGCFRTGRYPEVYCGISIYLQSTASQGYNPLVAIQVALAGRAVERLGRVVTANGKMRTARMVTLLADIGRPPCSSAAPYGMRQRPRCFMAAESRSMNTKAGSLSMP